MMNEILLNREWFLLDANLLLGCHYYVVEGQRVSGSQPNRVDTLKFVPGQPFSSFLTRAFCS